MATVTTPDEEPGNALSDEPDNVLSRDGSDHSAEPAAGSHADPLEDPDYRPQSSTCSASSPTAS